MTGWVEEAGYPRVRAPSNQSDMGWSGTTWGAQPRAIQLAYPPSQIDSRGAREPRLRAGVGQNFGDGVPTVFHWWISRGGRSLLPKEGRSKHLGWTHPRD